MSENLEQLLDLMKLRRMQEIMPRELERARLANLILVQRHA